MKQTSSVLCQLQDATAVGHKVLMLNGHKTLLHGKKSQKVRRAVVKNFLNPANFGTIYVLILMKEFSEIFYYLIIQRSYNTLVPREMLLPPQ